MKNKIKKISQLIISVFFIGLILYSIVDLFGGNKSLLTIDVHPEGAKITVSDAGEAVDKFEKKLKNGEYIVTAEKEGYIKTTREIDLVGDLNITINLQSTSTSNTRAIPISLPPIGNINSINNSFLGVNKGNLLFFENGSSRTIYPGRVRDFSMAGDQIAIIDTRNQSEVIIINKSNNSQRKINLNDYTPVISVTLSNNGEKLYFLGNFGIANKTPTLYSTDINNVTPTKILETRALDIEFIKDSKLAMLEIVHEIDQSQVHLIDTNTQSPRRTYKANSFQISPDKTKILLRLSNSVTIIDTTNFQVITNRFTEGNLTTWKDDNNIIALDNTTNGTEFALITLNPNTFTDFQPLVGNSLAKEVYGVINKVLYYQDRKGNVVTVNLP